MRALVALLLAVPAFSQLYILPGGTGTAHSAITYSHNAGFTIQAGNSALTAGSPSRAYTLALSGDTLASDVTFTLTDNASGSFYPSSSVTITAGSTTAQFIYTPPAGAAGSVTLTAVASGGLVETHTLTPPIATNAGIFAKDLFASSGALIGSAATNGGNWTDQTNGGETLTKGTGNMYGTGTGHVFDSAYIPTAPTNNEQDVDTDIKINAGGLIDIPAIGADMGVAGGGLVGYRFGLNPGVCFAAAFGGTGFSLGWTCTTTPGSTVHLKLAIRNFNGVQYLFFLYNGALLQAYQDASFSTGFPGVIPEVGAGNTATSGNASQFSNFIATNLTQSGGSDLIATFPNANIYLSPYTWRKPGDGSIIAPTGGAYIKGVVSGTTKILANVDTSTVDSGAGSGDMPTIKVIVDDAAPTFVQFPVGATQVTLASGLTTAQHKYRLEMIGGDQTQNGWSGTYYHTKINSLEFDALSSLALPKVYAKTALVLGDSYLQGYFGGFQVNGAGSNYYNAIDPSYSWPKIVSNAVGFEFGQIGYGGTGWLQAQTGTTGGAPAGPSFYDHFDSTHSKSPWEAQPDYVIEAWGINDHRGTWTTGQVQTAATSWFQAARAYFPAAKIVAIIPPGGVAADLQNRAPITAAVSASGVSVQIIDMGQTFASAIPFLGSATWMCADGAHPSPINHGLLGGIIANSLQ